MLWGGKLSLKLLSGFGAVKTPAGGSGVLQTAAQFQHGQWISPTSRLLTYGPDEWEEFVEEWVSSLRGTYLDVLRYTGAGDMGIDVAGFVDDKYLEGMWDNYQCKHYGAPLGPGVLWPEIGKMLWYSYNGHFVPPRAYYFVSPLGTSTLSTRLLGNPKLLREGLFEAWDKAVRTKVASTPVELDGDFLAYVKSFDLSVFRPMSVRTIVEQHRSTPYHIPRFGGGLPARPKPGEPPVEPVPEESGYVAKLLEAYGDHLATTSLSVADLKRHPALADHLKRSREAFYHAESLRVFVRDKVEPGTYENLQDEVYGGVIDTRNSSYDDA